MVSVSFISFIEIEKKIGEDFYWVDLFPSIFFLFSAFIERNITI